MRRWVLLTMIAVLLVPAGAGATVVSDRWGHERVQPWQTWADRTQIPLMVPGVTVDFATCPSTAIMSYGCLDAGVLFVDPASPAAERQRIFFHELGHRVDATVLTVADREAFRRVALAAGGLWLKAEAGPTAGEQFAEAFSLCAIHRTWDPDRMTWWSIYWRPSPARHLRVCAWLRSVAQRVQQ